MCCRPVYSSGHAASAMCYDRLLKVFQTMPSAQKQLIVAWILHDVSKELFVNRLVEPALVRLLFR